MPWRRFLLLAALLLAATSVVSAVGTSERRLREQRRPATTLAAPPSLPAAPVVSARLPRAAAVRARVGDVVRLTVRSRFSDTAEVPQLAVEGPVDRSAPARLTFVAERSGRFAVRLREAGEAVGTLVVADAPD
jgi:hypothetical protein